MVGAAAAEAEAAVVEAAVAEAALRQLLQAPVLVPVRVQAEAGGSVPPGFGL